MTLLQTLAFGDIPVVGQQILAKCSDSNIRHTLANAPQTDISVINTLARDTEHTVRYGAWRRTTDTTLLQQKVQPDMLGAIAQNTLTSPKLLAKMLASEDSLVAFYASINPATPEAKRRKQITRDTAQQIIQSKWWADVTDMRSHELILANQWMLETPTRWCEQVQNAMTGSPEATQTILRTYNGILASEAKLHPAYNGGNINSLSIDSLLETGSIAAQIHAMRRPEFTEHHAKQIITKMQKRMLSGPYRPDAHIAGRLINRYGVAITTTTVPDDTMFGGESSEWTGHLSAAALITPILHHTILGLSGETQQDIANANSILADSADAWHAYATLLTDWYGTFTEAAKTVCTLCE